MATRIQLRRGTAAEWASVNPVLAAAEVGVELDTNKFKIGDGVKSWNNLSYAVQTDLSKLNNDVGFITINDVETAGYTKNQGTVKSVNNVQPDANGNVTIAAGEGVKSVNNIGPDASGNVTIAIPPEVTDTTVGNWGYTKNAGTVTKVNNTTPDAQGNVSIAIPAEVTETTVTNWGFTKNTGTVTQVNDSTPDANGKVTIAIPPEVTDSTVSGWGYTKNQGTVKSVNSNSPDANGNVSLAIPPEVTDSTVSGWGYTKNKGTVTQVNDSTPDASGKVTIAIPPEVTDSTVSGWGYTKNTGTVTSVNNTQPVNGNVTLSIPAEVTETTVTNWGFTKNEGTVTSVNNTSPVDGNVTLAIPPEVTDSTVGDWGYTKNTGTVTAVNNISPVDGNVSLSIPSAASDISYTNPEYPTVAAALDQLLYVKPTVSMTGGNTYEDGTSLSSAVLNWSTNKAITTQSIDQGIGSLDPALRTYTYSATTLTTDKKFTITVGDGKNTATSSTTFAFKNKKFYGISAKDSLTDAEIKALSNNEWCSAKTLAKRSYNCTPTSQAPDGFYIYYALPTSFVSGGDPTFKINGLQTTAYLKTVKTDYKNGQNKTVSYTIYRFMADNKLTTTYELEAV